jgi:hypothetical protein
MIVPSPWGYNIIGRGYKTVGLYNMKGDIVGYITLT